MAKFLETELWGLCGPHLALQLGQMQRSLAVFQ